MERLAGRYDLIEQITRGKSRTLWRGHDVVLDRPVGVLILDRDNVHAEQVRRAAQTAARVEHPSLLRVLDADLDDGRVFVVTRWLQGPSLADLLNNAPMPPGQAVQVTTACAKALVGAATAGLHHLVLDPRDVLVTDQGIVVIGVGVRAALAGAGPDDDPERTDAWRLGALLYAALTGRWPGDDCAGLAAAPMVDGRVARPRQVLAGVPHDVDDVAWRALQEAGKDSLDSPAAVAAALDALKPRRRLDVTWTNSPERRTRWSLVGLALVVTLVVTAGALVAWQVWQDSNRSAAAASPRPAAEPTTGEAAASSAAVPSTASDLRPFSPGQAVAFDPAGDGEENDELAPDAIDRDPATAWRTLTYASRELGELKPGVGLRVTSKPSEPVNGIDLALVGRGSDVQIWAQRRAAQPSTIAEPLAGYRQLASVRGASDQVTLFFSSAVTTRSFVVWLTALPADADGFSGGVAEVRLLP